MRRAAVIAALVGAGTGALACDETILLEYQVSNGRYQFELNGVYLDSGAAQGASGGLPIRDWLLKGDNTISVSMDAASGVFEVYAICEDGLNKRSFDQVSLTGRQQAELVFPADDPPQRPYLGAAPTSDAGLLDAVAALKAAMTARDVDAVWDLHAAMRADMEARGQPMKAAAYQMGKIVEAIEPDFADNLQARPVLGGRVWEVYGDRFAPPISALVEANGGQVEFKTGSYWMKTDRGWSVFEK